MQSLPFAAVATILLGLGVACCAAGLWMLLRRTARIAAGPLLLLTGLALLALPWLAAPPVAPLEPPPVALSLGPVSLSADGQRTVAGPGVGARPPPLPGREAVRIGVEAGEQEPNDMLPAANLARLGVQVEGTLPPGDRDWFAVEVPAGLRSKLVATVVTEQASVTMTLFDAAGQSLGIARTIDEVRVRTATLERDLRDPVYYLLLMPGSDVPARYQLTLAARRW